MASESSSPSFWLPPPAATSSLPSIREKLSRFSSPALRISRVGQLDGALLDQELEGMLGGPVWKALAALKTTGRRDWEPEMLALLRLAVLKLSLWDREATYGSSLQNLKYRNERKHAQGPTDSSLTPVQKGAYIALQVLPSYLYTRIHDVMLQSYWADEPLPRSWLSLIDVRRASKRRRRNMGEQEGQWKGEWKRVIWEILGLGERVGAVVGLANFLVFLYDGRYRTLVDRLLGMRLVYAQRSVNRNVSFEFLNRQLVWEAFTEFLLFLMPLINLHRLRIKALRFLSSRTSKTGTLSAVLCALPHPLTRALGLPAQKPSPSPQPAAPSGEKPLSRPQGPLYMLPDSTCPICYSLSASPSIELPTPAASSDASSTPFQAAPVSMGPQQGGDTSVKVPYVVDCGWQCRYCYYCVVGKLVACEEEAEPCWECLRCGGEVRGAEREAISAKTLAEDDGTEADRERQEDEEGDVDGGEAEDLMTEDESVGSQHETWRS